MRNQNSRVRVTKRRLSKCKDVCRTYNDIQFAYADILEKDSLVIEFRCNVVLSNIELDGTFTTDFLITKINGDLYVRECVRRDMISKPLTVKLLDASRTYWLRRGIEDWGIVIDETT